MPKRTKSYESGLHDRLLDPGYAMEYLRAALEDDDDPSDVVFLLALRDVATANHMTHIAETTGLNRESLYKMLSERGNPGLSSVKAVLNAVGLKLSVELAARPCAGIDWTASQTIHVRGSLVIEDGPFSYARAEPQPRISGAGVGLWATSKPPPCPPALGSA